jgi:hypothetical protein
VGLAGAAGPEGDDILTTIDVFAARQLPDQGLVERRDGFEVEAVEAFHGGEARRLDAPLDHAALPVDQLQLGQAQQISHVVDAFCGAEPGHLVVLAQDGRQLELLEMMGEENLRGVAHGSAPDSRLM